MEIKEHTNITRLTEQFTAQHDALRTFVGTCSQDTWTNFTAAEGWPVGVTARHIAVAHYPVIEWVQMIIEGQPLPAVTFDTINALNAQHAADHNPCSRQEVLDLLQTNHATVMSYLQTIGADDAARQGYLRLFDVEISAAGLFQAVLIDGVEAHFSQHASCCRVAEPVPGTTLLNGRYR